MARAPTDDNRRLLQYYKDRPGEIMHYGDVADGLGMMRSRANAYISRLAVKHPSMGISRSGPMGHYVYKRPDIPVEPPHGYVAPETRSAPGLREATWDEVLMPADETTVRELINDAVDFVTPSPRVDDPIGEMYEAVYVLTVGNNAGKTVVKDTAGNLYVVHPL
jgi:hypothetical protein